MKKFLKFIKLKIEKRELLKYLIWKLGLQKALRHQVFSHPIRYLMYKWYSLYLLTVKSKSELIKGLMPAINEFLEENTNWIIKEKVEYNNGLTVLMKVDS